jgi:EAL domain-containing protein (putative c-di-GMP-specific phosphodiesterase class I)
VEHTVALAHALGISLVAEGVETIAHSAVLTRLGCDVAQGYAIAHPMPVDEFVCWLVAAESAVLDERLMPQLSHGRPTA